jgi:type IV secretory pathway VirB4 component
MLMVGQSGKGKTMTANVILGRCMSMGGGVFGIDRAGHYGILTRLVPGGREIDIGADDSPWAINPWDVPDPAKVGLQKVTFLKSLHGLMMGADGLSVAERAQLDTAIRQVYAWAANRRLKPRESMLRAALLERAETERGADNPELASTLRHLAERLSEFCDEGSYAYLLDRDTNVPADAPAVVFDTRRCPTELLQLVMFMIVEYVREARTLEGSLRIRAHRFPGLAQSSSSCSSSSSSSRCARTVSVHSSWMPVRVSVQTGWNPCSLGAKPK